MSVDVPSPGTRGDVTVSVRYERVSAKRQSDREMTLTLSNSSAGPVMGKRTFEGLPVGDFIVTAIARNDFGKSELSEGSITFQVTGECEDVTHYKVGLTSVHSLMYVAPPSPAADNTGAIIGGIVGAILGILVLILVILIIVLCCMKYKSDSECFTKPEV